jgi:hypothetical protein
MDGKAIREEGGKKIKIQQEVLGRTNRLLSFEMTWTA